MYSSTQKKKKNEEKKENNKKYIHPHTVRTRLSKMGSK